MKPITFESIRNFIKTKKKSKKDGADTSFKRSDSFKRISIRKSYLDRGRNKRTARAAVVAVSAASGSAANQLMANDANAAASANVHDNRPAVSALPTFQDVGGVQQQHHQMAPRRSLSVVSEQHYSSRDDVNDDQLLKNKSLHEINEICGGSEVVKYDVIVRRQSYAREEHDDAALLVCDDGDIRDDEDETEVQMVQMNFGESIYDNLAENAKQDDDDDNDDHNNKPNHEQEDAYGDHHSITANTTSCSYFMLHDNIYDRADSITTTRNPTMQQGRCESPASTNVSSLYVNHRDDQPGHPFSDPQPMNTPSSVTFTTFGEPRIFLETSFDSPEPQSIVHTLNSTTSRDDNVSRTSLNKRTDIDSHTFKMPHKAHQSDGVVIRIPANPPAADASIAFKPAKTTVHLNSPAAELSPLTDDDLETSLNGKFTFEIYKELQKSQDSHRPTSKNKHSVDLNDQFSSLQLHHSTTFCCESLEEPDFYDVLPPVDSTIPHSVRLKINPFTRQKELYSVNLGRIWKQLNLGQDDMSLDGSSMQGNFKKKNESFKSMSSQDSGFSLTLTKPKSPFRGRSKKGRRKTAAGVLDSTHPQRTALLNRSDRPAMRQRKSTSAATAHSSKQLAGEYGFSGRYNANEFDATLRRTLQRQRSGVRCSPEQVQDENVFLREFEQFCLRRNQMKLVQKNQFREYDDALVSAKSSEDDDHEDDLDYMEDDDEERPVRDSFKQEINDLEAFFEAHLKRLKDYYLQKKQITERTIDTICNDYEDDEDHLHNGEDDHNGEFHSLGRSDSASPQPLVKDFNFPHPDKRVGSKTGSAKQRSKFHATEVRYIRKPLSLNYAALEFPASTAGPSTNTARSEDRTAYADLQFPGSFPDEQIHSKEQAWPKPIALSAIFPAASSSTVPLTPNPAPRCPSCYGLQRKRPSRRRRRSSANSVQQTSSSNDEFSENEFIANSIGRDGECAHCDNTDCDCDGGVINGHQWCTCAGDPHGADHLSLLVRCDSAANKSRRMKRKKSKRRTNGGRNHSTLRRCSSYYNTNNSSKCRVSDVYNIYI